MLSEAAVVDALRAVRDASLERDIVSLKFVKDLVIEGGRVIEQGTHDALMAARGRYRAMFDLQASRFLGGQG